MSTGIAARNYTFPSTATGSFITQETPLPNPRRDCSSYLTSACAGPDCGSKDCFRNCSTGCDGYLSQSENAQLDLCCHTYGTTCEKNCGQSQNMASCGVLVEDVLKPEANAERQMACTRSCQGRCLDVPGAVSNSFPYMGIFQVSRKSDDSTDGCRIPRDQGCSSDKNPNCQPMLNDSLYRPWQSCTYNTVEFANDATEEDWSKVRSALGNPDEVKQSRNYDELMVRWCAASVSGPCPMDPIDLTTSPSCSRYYSAGEDGMTCRSWVDGKPANVQQNYRDAIGYTYCTKAGQNTNECKCINRTQDQVYQATKPLFPANDGCWYQACTAAKASSYFVPSDVTPAICPTNVCANIILANNYQNTYINSNQTYMDCDF